MCTPCNGTKAYCKMYPLFQPDKYSISERDYRLDILMKMLKSPEPFKAYYESVDNAPCPFCLTLFWDVKEIKLIDEIESLIELQLKYCPVCDDDYDRKDYSEPCEDDCDYDECGHDVRDL